MPCLISLRATPTPWTLVAVLTLLALASCTRQAGSSAPEAAPAASVGAAALATAPAPEHAELDRSSIIAGLPPVPPELGELIVKPYDPTANGGLPWVASGLLTLVDAPGSKRIVGHLARGVKATPDAAEIHVRPNAARVVREWSLRDGRVVKPGDVLWVLDGHPPRDHWVWWNGVTTSEFVWPAWDTRATRDPSFWLVAGDPTPRQMWSHVTTPSGLAGWVDTTDYLFDWTDSVAQDSRPRGGRRERDAPPIERPEKLGAVFIDRDACPFECCHFGEVTARGALALVATPQSASIVAHVWPGEVVTAEGDEVHVIPTPVRVRIATTFEETVVAAKGEIVWLLEAVGEGAWHVWRDGRVFEVDDPDQWSDPVGGPVDPDFHWWVRVRTESGAIGWFDNTDGLFSGFDGCA